MKRRITILTLFLCLTTAGPSAQSQDKWLYPHLISNAIADNCGERSKSPVLKEVELSSSVSLNAETGIYTYGYTLKNGALSTGCLSRLEIDIVKPSDSVELSDYGLKDYPRYIHRNVRDLAGAKEIIPVAFPDLPRRNLPQVGEVTIWDAGIARGVAARWGASLEQVIPPSEEISGFILITYGIPTIRDFKAQTNYVAGDEDVISRIGTTKEQLIEDPFPHYEAFYESIAYKGKTIGPTAPPAELKPVDFLDNIIDMKHEAFSLGWITNKGIERNLDAKLNAARKKLSSRDYGSAQNILTAFMNEVEAQGCETRDDCPRGKHLMPEAYALLKYNAQYLADNLK
jgi:hypothetical protein